MKPKSFAKMQCSVARTLEQVGPWWSLLIIRNAMMGARRFKHFEESLGIAKNTLTDRLAHLVDAGILKKVPSTDGTNYENYELTDKGNDLAPVIMALAQWGDRWARHEAGPSFALIDTKTGGELPRILPRRSDGQIVPLDDICLKRLAGAESEAR